MQTFRELYAREPEPESQVKPCQTNRVQVLQFFLVSFRVSFCLLASFGQKESG